MFRFCCPHRPVWVRAPVRARARALVHFPMLSLLRDPASALEEVPLAVVLCLLEQYRGEQR